VSTHYMDEAERCHQLAILEHGRLRNQGSPAQLMAQLESRVVEIGGSDLRRVKEHAMGLPLVQSAAQQGLHLRILMSPDASDPLSYLREGLDDDSLSLNMARPSLEDVFVAATQEQHSS